MKKCLTLAALCFGLLILGAILTKNTTTTGIKTDAYTLLKHARLIDNDDTDHRHDNNNATHQLNNTKDRHHDHDTSTSAISATSTPDTTMQTLAPSQTSAGLDRMTKNAIAGNTAIVISNNTSTTASDGLTLTRTPGTITNKTSSPSITSRQPLIEYTIPSIPDLSIITDLQSIIPTGQYSPLSTCSPTSQIKIIVFQDGSTEHNSSQKNTTNTTTWVIQALDKEGNKKTVGGDEFYIKYTETKKEELKLKKRNLFVQTNCAADAVAIVVDNQDGTYTLDFVTIPLRCNSTNIVGKGILTVNFVYTCSIGRMTRPSKDAWANGGSFQNRKQYSLANVTMPHIRRQYQSNILPNRTRIVDLSKFDSVACFGDSQLEHFCGCQCPKCGQPNLLFSPNAGNVIRSDILDQAYAKLKEYFGNELLNSTTKSALILNSAAWEIAGNTGPFPGFNFSNSLQMYEEYVHSVRKQYPNVTIFWKSPQPLHMTVIHETCQKKLDCRDRTRYMSISTAEYLYGEQKKLMNELGVPILDVWEASYAAEFWHMDGDALHYRYWFSMYMQDMFYPDSMNHMPH